MNQANRRNRVADDCADPSYEIFVVGAAGSEIDGEIRDLIARTRGDLRTVVRHGRSEGARLRVQVGCRRLDAVVTALEAAGFEVSAVVGRRTAVHPSVDFAPPPAVNARSSNL